MDEIVDFQHKNHRNLGSNLKEKLLYENIRIAILNLVSSIVPFDELEKEHVQFVLSWLKSGVQIFRTEKPAKPNPHLVAYFVVVDVELRKILLVDHNRGEMWFPTGGHVEPAEHPQNTVKREACEELGIEADFLFDHPLLVTITESVWYTEKHTDVSLWYLLRADSNYQLKYNKKELNRIHWFDWEQIPFQRSDPHLMRFMEKTSSLLSLHFGPSSGCSVH